MKTIYFNQDNHHFYGYHPASDMTREGLEKLVDFYAAYGTVKGILFCTNVQRALYDSDVWERFKDIDGDDPLITNLRLLSERGIDHFRIWIDRCRYHGVEGWLSMRMNDCHGLQEFLNPENTHFMGTWPSKLWQEKTEWRRAPYRRERSWEYAFNYSLPEVRAHHLALVEEIFERFDMDGLELDWLRWGMIFPPGNERESWEVLTDFIRQVREFADRAEKRLGHRIKLAHRVPPDPQICLNFGFDVVTWARKGMADMITLSSFLGNGCYDPPLKLWRAMLPENTHLNFYIPASASSYPGAKASGYEFLYGEAATAWSCGVDGVYLFNECYRESDNPELLKFMLSHIGSPESLSHTIRRCAVTFQATVISGDSLRTTLPLPLIQHKTGVDFTRMEQNITLRISVGRINLKNRYFLRLGFSHDTDVRKLQAMLVRVNTNVLVFASCPELDTLELPADAAFSLVWHIPSEVLHETFNAVEFIPPQIPGLIVWAEIIVLP